MADRPKRGWLKKSCLGCLGVAAVFVLVALTIVAIGLVLGPAESRIERPKVARELPLFPAPRDDASHPGVPDEAGAAILRDGPAGRVVLDLSLGRFEILAGEPGEPIRVEGQYDAASYSLSESLESEGELGWVYRLSFRRDSNWIRQLFANGAHANRLRLVLPRDTPLSIEGRIGIGESRLDLGGLHVTGVDLDFGIGSHEVGFHAPTPQPMERFRISGSIGQVGVFRLGNASPKQVWADNRIGPLELDLAGRWRNDSSIAVRGGIGGFVVRVPEEVAVVVDAATVRLGQTDLSALEGLPAAGEGRFTLTLEISAGIGEVRVDR